MRRRHWLIALMQVSESRAAIQRLAATASTQHRPAGHEDPGAEQSAAAATVSSPPLSAQSAPLLSSQWSHVLLHRSSALSDIPSLLHEAATRALHAAIIVDVQVG